MEKKCKVCGKPLENERKGKIYCSKKCGMKAYSEAHKKEKTAQVCKVCGKPFMPSRSQQRYCSDECRIYESQHQENVCKVCGNTFYGYRNVSYCSPECRKKGIIKARGKEQPKSAAQGVEKKEALARKQGLCYADIQKAETLAMVGGVQ